MSMHTRVTPIKYMKHFTFLIINRFLFGFIFLGRIQIQCLEQRHYGVVDAITIGIQRTLAESTFFTT